MNGSNQIYNLLYPKAEVMGTSIPSERLVKVAKQSKNTDYVHLNAMNRKNFHRFNGSKSLQPGSMKYHEDEMSGMLNKVEVRTIEARNNFTNNIFELPTNCKEYHGGMRKGREKKKENANSTKLTKNSNVCQNNELPANAIATIQNKKEKMEEKTKQENMDMMSDDEADNTDSDVEKENRQNMINQAIEQQKHEIGQRGINGIPRPKKPKDKDISGKRALEPAGHHARAPAPKRRNVGKNKSRYPLMLTKQRKKHQEKMLQKQLASGDDTSDNGVTSSSSSSSDSDDETYFVQDDLDLVTTYKIQLLTLFLSSMINVQSYF